MRDASRAGPERSRKGNKKRDTRDSLYYKCRVHAYEEARLCPRVTQRNNGQPYRQLFHFACNNWQRAGRSEGGGGVAGEVREAKCLLCARRSSLIKSRWPNDESRALR